MSIYITAMFIYHITPNSKRHIKYDVPFLVYRQRLTLPQRHHCSTISVPRLNLRVRYGNGCVPGAIATGLKLAQCMFTCLACYSLTSFSLVKPSTN